MSTATAGRRVRVRRTPGRLPWPPLLAAIAAAVLVVGLSIATGGGAALAAPVAGLALAAGAGYLLDDPAVAITQTLPRALWRRRSATVVRGLVILTSIWLLLLVLMEWREGDIQSAPLTLQTGATTGLALAAAALLARHGDYEPGNRVAPAVALFGFGALLLQPLLGITLLPGADGESTVRVASWAVILMVAALVVLAAWRDPLSCPRVARPPAAWRRRSPSATTGAGSVERPTTVTRSRWSE